MREVPDPKGQVESNTPIATKDPSTSRRKKVLMTGGAAVALALVGAAAWYFSGGDEPVDSTRDPNDGAVLFDPMPSALQGEMLGILDRNYTRQDVSDKMFGQRGSEPFLGFIGQRKVEGRRAELLAESPNNHYTVTVKFARAASEEGCYNNVQVNVRPKLDGRAASAEYTQTYTVKEVCFDKF